MYLDDNLPDIKYLSKFLEKPTIQVDLYSTFFGKQIGHGAYRSVYEYNPDPNYVIKIERESNHCNIVEHELWFEIQGLKGDLAWVKDWFAPIKWVSPNGRLLLMEKTKVIQAKPKPEKIPKFFFDVKHQNFGWLGDNYVCHDYASSFHGLITYSKRKVKVNWQY